MSKTQPTSNTAFRSLSRTAFWGRFLASHSPSAAAFLCAAAVAVLLLALSLHAAPPREEKSTADSALTEVALSPAKQKALLQHCRRVFDTGKRTAPPPNAGRLAELRIPLILTIFSHNGELLLTRRLDDAKSALTDKAARLALAAREALPPGQLNQVYLHLMVVSFRAQLPNFGITGVFDWRAYESRVTGVAYTYQGKRAEITPLESLYWNYGPKMTRAKLARAVDINPKKMPEKNDLEVEIYRVIHFGESPPDGDFQRYFRGHRILRAEDVDQALVRESLQWIAHWYKNNVIDGEVTYEFEPTKRRYRNYKRTMVRTTMAMWILNRLAFHLDDPELKRLGRESLEHYLEIYLRMDKSLQKDELTPSPNPLPNGDKVRNRYTAASFIIAAIVERGEQEAYKREIALILDWLKQFEKPDGTLRTQYGQSQFFMPGQLLLALASLYEATSGPEVKQRFERIYSAYERPLLQLMHLGNKRFTPYAPAWYTQPAALMHELTGENNYRKLVYRINDPIPRICRMNSIDEIHYDYDGMLAPRAHSQGNTSITAASLESLVDAAHVARLNNDSERRKTYVDTIRRACAFLLRLQYVPANTYFIRNKKPVLGAFKKDMVNNTVWMDNVWHFTSALIKIDQRRLFEADNAKP